MAKPKINKDLCSGCGLCVEECESRALALENETAVLSEPRGCGGCGVCAGTCPTGAVTLK